MELPDGALVHPVFHVVQFKPQVPDHTLVFSSIPHHVDLSLKEIQPKVIVDRRLVKKGNAAHLQVLIKWTSLPASMATWEDYEVLRTIFPGASAWGQADSQEGDSVMTEALAVELMKMKTEQGGV